MPAHILKDLLSLVGGRLISGDPTCRVSSFSLSDDPPARGGCHIRDQGPHVHEEAMLNHLVPEGVHALLVSAPHKLTPQKWSEAGIAVGEVPNMDYALYELAKLHRSHFDLPIVQVVGSSGKTTTKEMIASVLGQRFSVLATPWSRNSPLDAARALLRLTSRHGAAVIETGMLESGVITRSAKLIRPTFGIVTTVNQTHILRLGSQENIIAAKAEVLPHISARGALFINWDNEHCRRFPLHECAGQIMRFGFGDDCDIRASKVRYENFCTTFTLSADQHEFSVTLNTFGRYNVGNALAAAGVGLALGLSPEEIRAGLAAFRHVPGRLEVITGQHGITIINDNYNASPDSTAQLLAALPEVVQGRPLVLLLGDMERPDDRVAQYARKVHREIGQRVAKLAPCRLIAVGKWAREYVRGARAKGLAASKAIYFPRVEEARSQVVSLIEPGSVVVFKASLYTPISQLIDHLIGEEPGA